jgi:hypothetical protein
MLRHRICTRIAVIAFFVAVCLTGTAEAVTFNIVYDAVLDQQIGTILGTGTFSYDGPATIGSFPFQSLTGIAFTAFFPVGTPAGISFSTADVVSLSSINGITVFDAGSGQLGLVFTGISFSPPFSGSLIARQNPSPGVDFSLLSHEPTSSVDDRTGSRGNGTINAYEFRTGPFTVIEGDYRALAVPEPASLTLLGSALAIALTYFSRSSTGLDE